MHKNVIKKIVVNILVIIFTFIFSHSIFAKDIIVCKNCEIKSIKQALKISGSGDTLIIKKGVYKEKNIIINKPLRIIGEKFPQLDGEGKYQIISVISDNVFIKGLLIKNSSTSYIKDLAGIKLENVKNCTIENNRFKNNYFAIYLANSKSCKIKNNTLVGKKLKETSSANGIHLWNCKNILIENNKISGHRDGIYFEFVKDSIIKNNISTHNIRYGLHFMFSDGNQYLKNTFQDNGAGVAVMYSKNIKMIGNKFIHNWGAASYGLLLKDITDSYINNNLFFYNTVALYAEGVNRTKIEKNNFKDNGWVIKIMGDALDNYFYKNNFLGNTFDVFTNSLNNNNKFTENYWSNYQGYDLNKDKIGDMPYRPVRFFSIIIEENPAAIILLRSLFIEILDTAERIMPILTPETLVDEKPLMKKVQ